MHRVIGDLVLRSYAPADAESLLRQSNDRGVMAYMHDAAPHQYTLAEAEAWVRYVIAEQPDHHLLVCQGADVVGGVSLAAQQDIYAHSAELSYWVAPAAWRRGIATRAVGAVTEHAFWTLGLRRLYARVFIANPASARVLEKNGYLFEGVLRSAALKDGTLQDQQMYARVRED